VIAGGTPPARATVQAVTPGQPTRTVGELPVARTDHVAALVDGTIFVLGGGDASEVTLDSVVASRDGASWSDAGALAEGVRYPAVAAVDGAIYLFGGAREGAPDTVSVQRYDPSNGTTQVVAQLPASLSHASAVVLGGQVWVLGGFVDDTPSPQVLRFDPSTATVSAAGSLPAPVTDGAAVATGPTTGYLVGGEGPGRTTTAAVVAISVR
jgi:N-acetylneuraminic acid mutarotase